MDTIDRDEILHDIENAHDSLKWVERSLSTYGGDAVGPELLSAIQSEITSLRQLLAVADSKVRFL
jgi:hypothetical protein